MQDRFLIRLFWITVAAAFLIVLPRYLPILESFFAPTSTSQRLVTARGDLAADEKSIIELFERSKDSVVFISTKQQVMDFWTRNVFSVPQGTGSGFIWDEAGHVITNYHVIEGASEAWVKLSDGRSYRATLVGASIQHDIAVLHIGVGFKRPPPVPIGTSSELKVGQKVFAIGNPFGLDWTLTNGIVSALDRSLDGNSKRTIIEHLIQTDAAINPGNSGGPLLDSAGRLIGINTAIYSPSGASAGIGFAVPVDTVMRVVPQLIRNGKYISPSLGIELNDAINQRLASILHVQGIIVLRVNPDSAAEKAGLRSATVYRDGRIALGDVIVGIEGKPVESVSKLQARLDDFKIGDSVKIDILRDGEKTSLQVILQ
jgi:S1-C subfamily serine protease